MQWHGAVRFGYFGPHARHPLTWQLHVYTAVVRTKAAHGLEGRALVKQAAAALHHNT